MAGHTFFGKRKLCYTDVVDYTDFQGIGRDPLYMRYDSVYSVVKTAVPPEYRHFLAVPQYIAPISTTHPNEIVNANSCFRFAGIGACHH